jgi:hypothetical protein
MAEKIKQQSLLQRWQALDNEFSSWRNHYREINENLSPRTGRFFLTETNRGDAKRWNDIYDSSATSCLDTLSAGMMSGATSPARPWFRMAVPDEDMMQSESVKLWLSELTVRMLRVFNRSNTYRTLHTIYEEDAAYGTAASILVDDYRTVIHHHCLTAGEYRLAQDYKGNVNALYRQFQKTVVELVAEFGYKNCSRFVQQAYDKGALDTYVDVCHAIEPREDRDISKPDNKNMPYRSVYFELHSDQQDKFLREGGMRSFRVLAPRWAVSGGDVYGTSPGMRALGDIKQLQHQQYAKAMAIDYQVDPAKIFPTSAKNSMIDTLPGGISFVDTTAPQAVRNAFNVELNLQYLLEDISDIRRRIDAVFFTDLFRMLANDTTGSMTATEVAQRQEEKLLLLGPVIERLHDELLDPMITITFESMLAAQLVPPPPPELQGIDLQVEFVSMLAQAQRAIQTKSVDRFVLTLGQIASFKPDVLDKFDQDYWAETYSDALGVDPKLIVGDGDVALVRKQRQAQQAAAQAAAMGESMTKSAQNLAGANTQDKNALTDVTNAFSGYT